MMYIYPYLHAFNAIYAIVLYMMFSCFVYGVLVLCHLCINDYAIK